MELPIDARKAPFRQKYLDEETPMLNRWFTFGTSDDGTFYVQDSRSEIFCGLTAKQAREIERARQEFVDRMIVILNYER